MHSSIRLQNLRLLASECGGQGSLAQALGIAYDDLRRYFVNKHTNVGDAFAREIEQKLKKPNGWMDRPNFKLALTADEWEVLMAYRAGNERDKMYFRAISQLADK